MLRPARGEDDGRDGPASADDGDVPALVLCTICGRTDCAGCTEEPRSTLGSTPWESRGSPAIRRLWQTARLATVDGEAFFGGLADGSLGPAFGFAFTCELVAIFSFALVWGPLAYALLPGFVESILADPGQRRAVVAWTLAAVPLLSVLMVLLHVSWALGLEIGLRVAGAKGRTAHSLRYALYSCGWDLVTSPFGFGAGCLTGGLAGASRELRAAVRIPRFATRAYLARARNAGERTMRRALLVAVLITGTLVLGGTAALAVGVVFAML